MAYSPSSNGEVMEHAGRSHRAVLNTPQGDINFYSLAVSLRTTSFNIQKFYMAFALR